MKIFVTGGTGFIGKHTVEALQARGHTILILAREKDPGSIFRRTKGVRFLYGDLRGIAAWRAQVKRFKPDAVLHLAWEGIPDYGPEQSMKNLAAGLKFIRFAASLGCRKIVCAGSSWEYGVSAGETREGDGIHPASAFTAAKTALHWIGREIAKENGTQFVWARIFFVYGPGQREASLIPYLIRCKEKGISPAIRNIDGANDFVYIGDVARALAMLVEKRQREPYALYNIASGRLTGVRDVANIVYGRKTSRRPPKKNSGFWANISKIASEIGWRPKIGIAAGIQKTRKYYRGVPQ